MNDDMMILAAVVVGGFLLLSKNGSSEQAMMKAAPQHRREKTEILEHSGGSQFGSLQLPEVPVYAVPWTQGDMDAVNSYIVNNSY